MDFEGSYALATDMIDEAKERFGERYVVNDTRYVDLNEICDIIDELIKEFDCLFAEATVDEETTELIISIVCDEIILQHGREHKFFDLCNLVDSIRFSKESPKILSKEHPDALRIDFRIDNLFYWVGDAYE